MTVIGIDPGPKLSAYVAWNGNLVERHGIVDNEEFLTEFCFFPGDVTAIEQIASFGMPVGQEVFETVHWAGRFHQWALQSGKRVLRIKRHEVKAHLCRDSKARDSNVRQALLDRCGPQGTKKSQGPTYGLRKDEWSALAIAVTAHDRLKGEK